MISAGSLIQRYVSWRPAKLASAASSVVADERTDTGCHVPPRTSRSWAMDSSSSTSPGSSASSTRRRSALEPAVTPRRSPGLTAATAARTGASRSSDSRSRSNARVFTTYPGGTAIPARLSSPRLPPLPPTCARSPSPISSNQAMCAPTPMTLPTGRRSLREQGDHATPAVDADALTVLDPRGRGPRAHHRGKTELPGHDGGVAHRAADVGYRARDLLEDRRPRRIGDLADEDVTLAHPADLLHRLHDARRTLDDTARGGKPAELAARHIARGAQPPIQALARDPPEHHDRRIVDHVADRTQGRWGALLGPLGDRRAAFRDDLRPVLRSPRRRAVRPGRHEIDDRGFELVVRELEHIVFAREKPVRRQQGAELADLVEEEVGVPVLAVELMPLDVRKYAMRETDHLIVGLPLLLGAEQLTIVLDQLPTLRLELP